MSMVKSFFSKLGKNQINKELIIELGKTELFKRLNVFELELISNLVHTRKYEINEIIFQKGDMGLGLFVILSGSVKVFNTPNGETFFLKKSQTFGEHALVENSNVRSYNTRASEVTELGVLLRPDLKDLMNTYPRIANKILLSLCEIISDELRITKKQLREVLSSEQDKITKVAA